MTNENEIYTIPGAAEMESSREVSEAVEATPEVLTAIALSETIQRLRQDYDLTT